MANVVIGNVEIRFEDVAHWLKNLKNLIFKGPALISALINLFLAVDKVVTDGLGDAANPTGLINIPMDATQLKDLIAVWPDVKAACADAGFKL